MSFTPKLIDCLHPILTLSAVQQPPLSTRRVWRWCSACSVCKGITSIPDIFQSSKHSHGKNNNKKTNQIPDIWVIPTPSGKKVGIQIFQKPQVTYVHLKSKGHYENVKTAIKMLNLIILSNLSRVFSATFSKWRASFLWNLLPLWLSVCSQSKKKDIWRTGWLGTSAGQATSPFIAHKPSTLIRKLHYTTSRVAPQAMTWP